MQTEPFIGFKQYESDAAQCVLPNKLNTIHTSKTNPRDPCFLEIHNWMTYDDFSDRISSAEQEEKERKY